MRNLTPALVAAAPSPLCSRLLSHHAYIPRTARSSNSAQCAAKNAVVSSDEESPVKFGRKSYWDGMYEGTGDRPAESYSWYCGWDELAPFWTELVPDKGARVLVPGTGNDVTPCGVYDAGWNDITAFDYSEAGVERARKLFGERRRGVDVVHADARDLPFEEASFDAVLDKGTLDAIYIAGKDSFVRAVREFGRVVSPGGVYVCVSSVVLPDDLYAAFSPSVWEIIHDGSLAFAPDGEATIDLGSELYSWRRRQNGG
mmetsp:Transcript_61395/g.181494  ORF Transcript_61395/g.181494 Transcript_61395/m.181494 type:complete len:257 (-) Transcript_61395:103-873(-)